MQETKQGGRREDVAQRRSTSRLVAVLTLAAALGVTGFLAAGSIAGGSGTQSSATVSLRKTRLGSILVNSKGHTLYLFAKDRNGKSACRGSCASFWPPLLSRNKPTAGPGLKASLLSTVKRSSGSLQVTYNRHPLYAFSLDKHAGPAGLVLKHLLERLLGLLAGGIEVDHFLDAMVGEAVEDQRMLSQARW